jgi:transaldolase
MKIFLDTANLDELRKAADWGIVDGVTTNPSLIAKEGRPIAEQIAAICEIVDGDVSAEVVATESEQMVKEGRELAKIHENVVVKVPLTRDGIRACSILSKEEIRTNVTLCFSPAQALLAAKAGAYIVSPFVGRLDDMGQNGMELIHQIVQIYDNYGFETQIFRLRRKVWSSSSRTGARSFRRHLRRDSAADETGDRHHCVGCGLRDRRRPAGL